MRGWGERRRLACHLRPGRNRRRLPTSIATQELTDVRGVRRRQLRHRVHVSSRHKRGRLAGHFSPGMGVSRRGVGAGAARHFCPVVRVSRWLILRGLATDLAPGVPMGRRRVQRRLVRDVRPEVRVHVRRVGRRLSYQLRPFGLLALDQGPAVAALTPRPHPLTGSVETDEQSSDSSSVHSLDRLRLKRRRIIRAADTHNVLPDGRLGQSVDHDVDHIGAAHRNLESTISGARRVRVQRRRRFRVRVEIQDALHHNHGEPGLRPHHDRVVVLARNRIELGGLERERCFAQLRGIDLSLAVDDLVGRVEQVVVERCGLHHEP